MSPYGGRCFYAWRSSSARSQMRLEIVALEHIQKSHTVGRVVVATAQPPHFCIPVVCLFNTPTLSHYTNSLSYITSPSISFWMRVGQLPANTLRMTTCRRRCNWRILPRNSVFTTRTISPRGFRRCRDAARPCSGGSFAGRTGLEAAFCRNLLHFA